MRRTTRDQLLGFLRVRWFCDQPSTLCFVYFNNIPWLDRDTVVRRLEYGDHIRVQMRSDQIQWTDLESSEDIECSMRIYADSPRLPEAPQAAQGSEHEEYSEPTTRSRSRDRDNQDNSEHGLEDEEEESLLSKAIAQVLMKELRDKVTKGRVQFWDWSSYSKEVEWLHEMHVYSAQIRADAGRLPDFHG